MTVPSGLAVAGKVLAIVVTCAAAALSLLLAFMLLSSLLGDPSNDPHGYALVFGSLLIVPVAIVGATALPFIARLDQHRARIITWAARSCGSSSPSDWPLWRSAAERRCGTGKVFDMP